MGNWQQDSISDKDVNDQLKMCLPSHWFSKQEYGYKEANRKDPVVLIFKWNLFSSFVTHYGNGSILP